MAEHQMIWAAQQRVEAQRERIAGLLYSDPQQGCYPRTDEALKALDDFAAAVRAETLARMAYAQLTQPTWWQRLRRRSLNQTRTG